MIERVNPPSGYIQKRKMLVYCFVSFCFTQFTPVKISHCSAQHHNTLRTTVNIFIRLVVGRVPYTVLKRDDGNAIINI